MGRLERRTEAVARSLKEFGFRQPIVVDEQGVIVAGQVTRPHLYLVTPVTLKSFLIGFRQYQQNPKQPGSHK